MTEFCRWGAMRMFATNVLQVMLVAANVSCIARDSYELAMLTSFGIQIVWWNNTSARRPTGWLACASYACGGTIGVAIGMWLF